MKQHLQIFGDDKNVDTTECYTNQLIAVIKRTQSCNKENAKKFGIKDDYVITAALIKELNIRLAKPAKLATYLFRYQPE